MVRPLRQIDQTLLDALEQAKFDVSQFQPYLGGDLISATTLLGKPYYYWVRPPQGGPLCLVPLVPLVTQAPERIRIVKAVVFDSNDTRRATPTEAPGPYARTIRLRRA